MQSQRLFRPARQSIDLPKEKYALFANFIFYKAYLGNDMQAWEDKIADLSHLQENEVEDTYRIFKSAMPHFSAYSQEPYNVLVASFRAFDHFWGRNEDYLKWKYEAEELLNNILEKKQNIPEVYIKAFLIFCCKNNCHALLDRILFNYPTYAETLGAAMFFHSVTNLASDAIRVLQKYQIDINMKFEFPLLVEIIKQCKEENKIEMAIKTIETLIELGINVDAIFTINNQQTSPRIIFDNIYQDLKNNRQNASTIETLKLNPNNAIKLSEVREIARKVAEAPELKVPEVVKAFTPHR